jgi:hypothetical protein
MNTSTFDTLKFATRLESAGFTSAQARATAEAFVEASGQELATKGDIAILRSEMQLMERDLKIWFGKMLAWQLSLDHSWRHFCALRHT